MRRLLAIDLDGTLVGPGGVVDPADVDAVARAQREGVVVAIATGRLVSGALPHARALALTEPMICADGGVLACARTGEALERRAIPLDVADAILRAMHARGLAPFALLADAIHGDAAHRDHDARVRGWAAAVTWHEPLLEAEAWRHPAGLIFAIGVGARDDAIAARSELAMLHEGSLEVDAFPLGEGAWAVRAQRVGCSKGTALAALAARLGVAREDVAAIGDWWNDVPMLKWAGRSFAMEHAPSAVKNAATDVVPSVRAAIARWLGDEP